MGTEKFTKIKFQDNTTEMRKNLLNADRQTKRKMGKRDEDNRHLNYFTHNLKSNLNI